MMNKSVILAELKKLDFEDVEVNIYLWLIEHGPHTPLELSRKLSIDRSKIYRSIEKLTKKSLVSESHTDWGKKFQASSPQRLSVLLEEKEDNLKAQKEALPTILEQLSNLPSYTQREFEIKHYHGQEGIRQMLWNQLSSEKELLMFGYKTRNEMVGKSYAEKIRAEQVERKIKVYEIENAKDQGNYWYTNIANWEKHYESRHISPKTLEIKQQIAIFNDTVSIINWDNNEEIGIEIVNKSFADMQRQLFWKFWKLAEKNN